MTAQKGNDLLLKVRDQSGANFETVAGLRARSISFNAQTVDISHSESVGRWRELLKGAGMRRASISGGGIFKDSASDARIRTLFFEDGIADWQIILPDFGILQGSFQITSLDYSGQHDGELTFEMALESAGALVFTPDGGA